MKILSGVFLLIAVGLALGWFEMHVAGGMQYGWETIRNEEQDVESWGRMIAGHVTQLQLIQSLRKRRFIQTADEIRVPELALRFKFDPQGNLIETKVLELSR